MGLPILMVAVKVVGPLMVRQGVPVAGAAIGAGATAALLFAGITRLLGIPLSWPRVAVFLAVGACLFAALAAIG